MIVSSGRVVLGTGKSRPDEPRQGAERSLAVGEAKTTVPSPIRMADPEVVRIIDGLECVDILLREVDDRFVGRDAALGDGFRDYGDAGFIRLE